MFLLIGDWHKFSALFFNADSPAIIVRVKSNAGRFEMFVVGIGKLDRDGLFLVSCLMRI